MKRNDIIIIILFILIAVSSAVWFMLSSNGKSHTRYIEIYVRNSLYKKIKLSDNNSAQTITIKTELGENVVYISNGKVKILDADCPDKLCVKTGYISEPGQTIVCLPHRVVVKITGEDKSETDDTTF